jgi:putative ubiquitin-RnfH superfamily antitoxin RatB of RatAB toxin-antitoxin module
MAMSQVEVCYATSLSQTLLSVKLPANSTVAKAIIVSGILDQFPEIDLTKVKVGIWSKKASLNDIVIDGDRIEIYRPLLINPNQARLLRAKRQ